MENGKTNKTILSVISIILSGISIIATIAIGVFQCQLNKHQNELEEIFYPLNYNITLSDKKFTYTIQNESVSQFYPNIEFVTGRPHKVAVIINKDNGYTVTGCSISPDNKYEIRNIKTEMPRDSFEYEVRYAYDYFYLYLEDAGGEPTLDLIFYKIDMHELTISEPVRYTKIDLLRLESSGTDYYETEMLNNYKTLLDKMNDLEI